jgi:hypothetical protein
MGHFFVVPDVNKVVASGAVEGDACRTAADPDLIRFIPKKTRYLITG